MASQAEQLYEEDSHCISLGVSVMASSTTPAPLSTPAPLPASEAPTPETEDWDLLDMKCGVCDCVAPDEDPGNHLCEDDGWRQTHCVCCMLCCPSCLRTLQSLPAVLCCPSVVGPSVVCKACFAKIPCEQTLDRLKRSLLTHDPAILLQELHDKEAFRSAARIVRVADQSMSRRTNQHLVSIELREFVDRSAKLRGALEGHGWDKKLRAFHWKIGDKFPKEIAWSQLHMDLEAVGAEYGAASERGVRCSQRSTVQPAVVFADLPEREQAVVKSVLHHLTSIRSSTRPFSELDLLDRELTWLFRDELMGGPQGAEWFVIIAELHALSTTIIANIPTFSECEEIQQGCIWQEGSGSYIVQHIQAVNTEGGSRLLFPGDKLLTDLSRLSADEAVANQPWLLKFYRDSKVAVTEAAKLVSLNVPQAMNALAVLSRAETWDPDAIDGLAGAIERTLDGECGECPEELLLCFMTCIVAWIACAPKSAAEKLQLVLLRHCEASEQVCASLFWALRQFVHDPLIIKSRNDLVEQKDRLERFQRSFNNAVPEEKFDKLQKATVFYSNLIKAWKDPSSNDVSLKEAWFQSSGFRCAPCFDIVVTGPDVSVNVKRMVSITKPVCFGVCGTAENGTEVPKRLMFKMDKDVLKEQLTTSMFKQLEQILCMDSRFLKLLEQDLEISLADFSVGHYRIQTVSKEDPKCAIIEMVSDAETFENIRNRHSQTLRSAPLFSWLRDKNWETGRTNQELARVFGLTAAFWIVASSLFGLGDRHSGNLMLRPNGTVLHIDYGHILGSDARCAQFLQYMLLDGEVRNDLQDIFDVVGLEIEGAFWEPLRLIFKVLRSNSRLIVEQLQLVAELSEKEIDVEKFVKDRCHTDLSEEVATERFEKMVLACADNSGARDFAHSAKQQLISVGGNIISAVGTGGRAAADVAVGGLEVIAAAAGIGPEKFQKADACARCQIKFANGWSPSERYSQPWRHHCRMCLDSVCCQCSGHLPGSSERLCNRCHAAPS